VKTFDTEKVSRESIIETLKENFDLTPKGIAKKLDLKKPIFQKTATY
jgi:S-adenosylmethionine synthetase